MWSVVMMDAEGETGIPWLSLLETAWRRRAVVLAIVVAGSLAAAVWAWRTPPLYRAHVTILLGAKPMAGPRTDAMADKAIESELEMLSSPELIRETLREVGPRAPLARAAESAQVRRLAHDIETNRIEETNVVEVAYRGADPRWAARFLNALVAKHVERIARLDEQANTRAFYQGERDTLLGRMQAAGDAASRFRASAGADIAPGDGADLHKALSQLDTEQATTASQHAEAQARVAYLQREIGRHPTHIATESETRESDGTRLLDTRLMQLEVQRSEAITKYAPGSTTVQSIDSQIAETRRLLAGQRVEEAGKKTAVNPTYQTLELDLVQRQAEAAALAARLQALAGERERVRQQADRLSALAPQLTRLDNDAKSASDAYTDYLHRAEEARQNRELDRSGLVNISVLDPAEVPDSAEPGKAGWKLLAAVLASLVAGLATAAIWERLDPAVNSRGQAERIAGVPVIGSVGT
jgi:polysaccharide biosynthesis transport protein